MGLRIILPLKRPLFISNIYICGNKKEDFYALYYQVLNRLSLVLGNVKALSYDFSYLYVYEYVLNIKKILERKELYANPSPSNLMSFDI